MLQTTYLAITSIVRHTIYCKPENYTNDTNLVADLVDWGIWIDIQQCLLNLVSNAESLILDMTNNTVEQFNNVIAKFIGGKRVNFTGRGSYQARCFGAVTSWNSDLAVHSCLKKKFKVAALANIQSNS